MNASLRMRSLLLVVDTGVKTHSVGGLWLKTAVQGFCETWVWGVVTLEHGWQGAGGHIVLGVQSAEFK